MNWVKVFGREILQANDFVRFADAGGRKICIIKTGNEFFATQPYCPHAGAALGFGMCREGKLVCPYHRYEYDLKTGRGNPGQGDYIDLYPVELRADGLYVAMKESLFKRLFG